MLAGGNIMALLRCPARATVRRSRFPLLLVGLLAVLILFAAACRSEGGDQPATAPEERGAQASTLVTVYRSATCGCCQEYERYLEAEGFNVRSIETEDLTEIRDNLGISPEMRSCHTAMIEGYFIEGHVPVEAIRKLLEERPPIGGIALPGMPPGSPGMGGDKEQPFIIYSIVEGRSEEFMTL